MSNLASVREILNRFTALVIAERTTSQGLRNLLVSAQQDAANAANELGGVKSQLVDAMGKEQAQEAEITQAKLDRDSTVSKAEELQKQVELLQTEAKGQAEKDNAEIEALKTEMENTLTKLGEAAPAATAAVPAAVEVAPVETPIVLS